MKRILVTGSRDWEDPVKIMRALVQHGPGIIVHGNARGADTLAMKAANTLGWQVEGHPAMWRKLGKVAGPLRNQHMVDLGADICLAFPLESSRGTWDCVRRARKAGIPVVITRT